MNFDVAQLHLHQLASQPQKQLLLLHQLNQQRDLHLIPLHGIGLYIYSGEDLPDSEKVEEVITEKDIEIAKVQLYTSNNEGKLKEMFFSLKPGLQEKLRDYANELKKKI